MGGGVSPGVGMAPQQLHQQKAHSSAADDSRTLQPGALHSVQAAEGSQNSLLSVMSWSESPPPPAVTEPFYMLGGAFENLSLPTSLLVLPEGMLQFR